MDAPILKAHAHWDHRFLGLARLVSDWSKDPSTKVGAVITNSKKQVISLGYNGFPRGVNDCKERYSHRETKLLFVAHAERNALDNAVVDVEGATLYSTLYPCPDCTKGIIQRGIARVVAPVPSDIQVERYNLRTSKIMLEEAGVIDNGI